MEFKRIIKREVDDSQGKRTIYFWETGEEIEVGLYKVRVPIRKGLRWVTLPREMFVRKNQEDGVVHDLYIDRRIDVMKLKELGQMIKSVHL